jgi:hypothetical protein
MRLTRGKKVGSEESLNRETSPKRRLAEKAQRIQAEQNDSTGRRPTCTTQDHSRMVQGYRRNFFVTC